MESLNLAVMGCIVNGPGESKHADIGISLPGTGEAPSAPVFIDGKKAMTLRGPNIAAEFKAIVEEYVARRYGQSVGRNRGSRIAPVCAVAGTIGAIPPDQVGGYCARLHQLGAAVEDRLWQLAGARFGRFAARPSSVNRRKQDK